MNSSHTCQNFSAPSKKELAKYEPDSHRDREVVVTALCKFQGRQSAHQVARCEPLNLAIDPVAQLMVSLQIHVLPLYGSGHLAFVGGPGFSLLLWLVVGDDSSLSLPPLVIRAHKQSSPHRIALHRHCINFTSSAAPPAGITFFTSLCLHVPNCLSVNLEV